MSATFSEMSQILRWMGRWRNRYEIKQAEKKSSLWKLVGRQMDFTTKFLQLYCMLKIFQMKWHKNQLFHLIV